MIVDAARGIGATVDVGVDSALRQEVYDSVKHGVYGQLSRELLSDRVWLNLGARYDHQEHYGGMLTRRMGLVLQPDDFFL